MKKIFLIVLVSFVLIANISAQKTTQKFMDYYINVTPRVALKSQVLSYSVESPLESVAIAYEKRNNKPTAPPPPVRIGQGGVKSAPPPPKPEPINLAKKYLNVIRITDVENTIPIKVTLHTTDFNIDTVYGFNFNKPDLDFNKPACVYSYLSVLQVEDKNGKVYMEKVLTYIDSAKISIKEFSESKFAARHHKYIEAYNDDFNKIRELYYKKDRAKYEEEAEKIRTSHNNKLKYLFTEYVAPLKEPAIMADLEAAKEILIDNYSSFSEIISMPIYGAKGKFDYTAINNSQIEAQEIIKRINAGKKKKTNYEEAKQILTKCIQVWEEETEKLDINDKKARINKKLFIGLQFNIANSYIILGEIEKSKNAFAKANKLIERKFMAKQGGFQMFAETLEKAYVVYGKYEFERINIFDN